MKIIKALSFLLIAVLIFTGCSAIQNNENATEAESKDGTESAESEKNGSLTDVDFVKDDGEMFSNRDLNAEFTADNCVTIQLNGNSASASSNSVKISGTTVQITEEATYLVSGTLNDGQIVVNANDNAKIQLVLNNASVTSANSAALYIPKADKVFVTLADGTDNTLANGGNFTAIDDNNIDGAVFSKQDLTFNGSGALTVTSPAGHGIVCKDDLVFTGGTYTVNSASHCLDVNDSVRIINATVNADAGKDCIHAENDDDESLGFVYISSGNFNLEAEGDGISASSFLQIADGTFNITAGGGSVNGTKKNSDVYGSFMGGGRPGSMGNTSGSVTSTDSSSMKGLKSGGSIKISGGSFTIDSADDAVHSNASVTIDGGVFDISSGDDGIHADEALSVNGGVINITESYEGLEALNLSINDGKIDIVASDDGLNAAGGKDESGFGGRDDGNFGNFGSFGGSRPGKPGDTVGGMGNPGGTSSSNGSIVISGGTINVKAGGDQIDSNGTLEIKGVYITVCGGTQGDTSVLDYDKTAVISGGTFIGTGASNMAQGLTGDGQGVIAFKLSNQSKGTQILVKDEQGNEIFNITPENAYGYVVLSSEKIVSGKSYGVTVGSISEEIKAQ